MCFQISLQELEQRRPLLEKQVTAAQNLKNKTSNRDTRNAITERSTSHKHTHRFPVKNGVSFSDTKPTFPNVLLLIFCSCKWEDLKRYIFRYSVFNKMQSQTNNERLLVTSIVCVSEPDRSYSCLTKSSIVVQKLTKLKHMNQPRMH